MIQEISKFYSIFKNVFYYLCALCVLCGEFNLFHFFLDEKTKVFCSTLYDYFLTQNY